MISGLHENAQLAHDTIFRGATRGIPTGTLYLTELSHIERIARTEPGTYRKNPEEIYIRFQQNAGTCLLDQFIPENPLSVEQILNGTMIRGATHDSNNIVVDGIPIDSPEAVVEHFESVAFPSIRKAMAEFDEYAVIESVINRELKIQEQLGPSILKTGHSIFRFPGFRYGTYGYVNYFMAYGLYPEIIEQDFKLTADLAALQNAAAVRAFKQASLPPLHRLDHDMADSRGTLTDIKSLDRIWFPHFARALAPVLESPIKLLWHCDGNLMQMVPRLLEVGLDGFQGFQYEDGMDYEKICNMKTGEGESLIVMAGVSVTTTLPSGGPKDVKAEIDWLVEKGPATGLILMTSSSAAPGVPWKNIETMLEGFKYYREHGRSTPR
ncbi:MAG: hypothetical protein HN368_11440 [Spirochaetales bacterium]|jgi:hypothetical protein|nr:hypothetical protein [Spirochaetales bacterium]